MNRPSEEPAVTPPGCVMSRLSASGPHRSSLWRRLRPRENAATLLRGARACLALLAATALLALAAPAQAQTEVWSATFTPVQISLDIIGCFTGFPAQECSSTAILSDNDFTHDSTDYTVAVLITQFGGSVYLEVNPNFTTAIDALTLVVGSTSLLLADATTKGVNHRTWTSSGVTLTPGTAITVKLTAAASTNAAPTVATEIPNQTAMSGTAFSYEVPAATFADADGDTLTYTATLAADTPLPSWLSFAAATRTFSGTPTAAGTVSVKVTASDASDSVSDTFDIVVSPPADTTAPRVASIARQTPASSPTNADSLTWRVTFSEAVSNVDTADFAVSGTTATLSVSAVSGVTGAYDVTASGGNLAGVTAMVTLSIASGHTIQDAASNALTNTTPTGANDNTYVVDNTAPTVTITGVPGTSSAAFTATFTFTEAVTGFVVGKITLGNATASNFTVTSTTVYTALITPTANGEVTVDVAADVATDAVGNGNTAATQASSTYTMPVPTITIAAGTTPVTEGASAAFTLTRSGGPPGNPELTVNVSVTETQAMVAAADKGAKTVIFQANSATAMLGVATVADSVDETDSVVTATVTTNSATYTVGTSSSATVTVTDDDTRGVTVSAETLAVNEGSSGTYTVKLDSEPTASVTVTPSSGNSDVTVSSALTFTTTNWSTAQTVTVMAAQDSDAVDDSATISHAVSGGDYGAVTAVSVTVTVDDDETADTTAPRVASIVRGTPSSSPTNADSLTWRVTFSEAVSNVDTADFAVSGTTATPSVSAVSGVTYDVTATGGNLAGVTATVTLSIAAGHTIQDAATNALTNTTPTGTNDDSYVVDNTAPTVTITDVPDTSSAAFTATFTFSEAVTGFVVGKITLGNATASSFMVTTTTIYTALITPTANGAVTVDVAVDAATDAAGNGNMAATQASSTYTASSANTAPTAAHNTVTTAEDRAYTFTAADFGFMDADTGAALASVKIVTVPAAGILALDGTAVLANGVVTKAEIDGDMLTFRPARDAHGVAYTTFTFKVNDGTDDSASAYTMTIDVTDAPAPVCTAPSFGDRREIWSGTVTVEEFSFMGSVSGYGFDSTTGISSLLPSAEFSIGSNNYTIVALSVVTNGDLLFNLASTTPLTATERAALRLHVCDEDLDFSDAFIAPNNPRYGWTATLDWSPPVVTRTVYLSLPANNVATGEPAITGTAQVGQELTADASPIADDDGLTDVDFTYQWLRVDADGTSNEEDITGEIAATYTLATDDEGKKIKVQVSFTDELSGVEMRTSAATVTVTAAGTTNTAPTAANNTVTTGEDRAYTFTAADFGFMDDDAGAALASVKIVTTPAAGILALDGTAVVALDDVTKAQIDGDMLTFRPALNADGVAYTTFTFKVNDGTDDSASAYTMTIDVTDSPAPVCTAPSFGDRREIWTGTVTVETLIRFSSVRLHGFDAQLTFGVNAGALDTPTFNIGSNAHTVNQAFVYPAGEFGEGDLQFSLNEILTAGEKAALRLHVCDTSYDFSATAGPNYIWPDDLDWSHPVVTRTLYLSLPANNVATGDPTITGTAQVGQDLTADASPIADDDGLPSSFTYKWFRVDSDGTSNEAEISGEIATTYTLTNDDAGKKIKVKVSFTDELSGEEMRTSAAYPSSGTVTTAGTNTAPTAADKTVTTGVGTAYTFTAADFGFMDADAGDTLASVTIVTPPAPGTLALDGTAVLANAVVTKAQIDGNMLTFTPVAGASGDPYTTFTFTVNDGTDDSASAYTMTIDVTAAGGNIPATGAPTITGTAQVGQTLTAVTTGIMDADGLTSATYMYQWIRANGTEANIASANSSTYALVAADLGKTIKVKVSFTDDASNTETLTSAATATVTAATVTPVSSGLVSNVGQSESDSFGLAANDLAQSFTTGTNATGYTLNSIELRLSAFVSTVTPTVTLHSGSATGTEVATLTGPAMLDAGTIKNYTFTPSSTSTALLASTPYWVVAEGDAYWVSTTSTSEDATPATGWSIANNYESRHASSTGSFTTFTGFAFKIRVNGTTGGTTPTNTAPTAANNTVTTDEDMAYTFEADDFGFADTDAGAALASVKIVTLPTPGTLALDGTDVTLKQVVTKAQIDGDMLIFTPVAGASGDPYTTFTFKVNDGTDDSASAYTMTIDVTAAGGNIPATGAPTITGTAQVGKTLTAVTTGITDADGLTSATYMYQWIRVNSTEADITSANSSTYALVAADLGKTIKVKVSFTDDASNTETLTSAATATVTAATVTPVSSGLVSNVGQSESDSFGLAANDFAQSFTTGINPTGYTLTSIELRLIVSTVTPTVTLHSGSATGTKVATLTGPAMLDAGTIKNYTFTPSSTSTALLASTPYWVVAEGDAYWVSTTSTSEDATPATGWSIANNYESRHASSTGSFTTFTGFAFKIRVNGTTGGTTPTNTAPTAANNTVTTGVGTAYTFTAADFGFMDADAGAALASVTIVTLPTPGTLALDGTAVLANAVVTKAQIDGDMLIFTPVAGASGDPYTTFTFKVNDGTDDSASAYTMTIDVTDAPNNAPTVANAIPNQTAMAGTALNYAFPADTFADTDTGDTLAYTATQSDDSALPSWLSFAAATRTFSGTPMPADVGTVSVKVTASDGNGGSVSDTFDIVVSLPADTTAPRVASIVRGTPSSSPTNADSLIWRVTFSEAVSNVDTADFAVTGTTATLSVSAVSGVTYDVTASGGNLAGVTAPVTLSIAAGHNIQDAATNALTNTTPTGTNDKSYVVDNTAPTVTITGVPTTSIAAFTATFTFSEAVTGFVVGKITLGNATASSFMVTTTTIYTALITPTANGAVTVDVAADAATDAVGNGNTAATQASSTYTMPVPTITIAAGTTPVTEGASAAFTLTRSGGPPGNPELTVNVSVTETQDMVAAADKGAKTVIFQANSATAMLGVATVADSVDETDSVVTATVTANPATYTVGTSSSATVTVTDDDTRGVTVSAETLAVNEGSSGTYTVKLDSEPTASVTVTPSSGNSDVTVSSALTFTTTNWSTAQMVTVTAAQDSDAVDDSATISHAVEGGDYGAVTAASVTVTVDDDETADTTAPTVASIARQTPASSPTNADSLTWRVTFSEAVSNVDTADFAVTGTTATLSVSAVSGVTYDVTATGGNLPGVTATVTLSIATGHDIQDAASTALTNTTPTGTNDKSYVVDNTAPTVTITGVPTTSIAAFTATFTFSEAVTGFVVGKITLGNATASSFMVTTTTVYTALITPTANGAVTVDVAADAATDAAGNGNTAATQASSTYTASSANNAAMGAPTITGTAQVGETLTAVTTGIMDADGLINVTYTYQWIRVNGTAADITSANSSTYLLVAADLGKTIKVKVSFTDDASHAETLTSAASVQVTRRNPPPPPPPTNTAPVVANPPVDQEATTGDLFTYVIPADAFTDADGDMLTYTAALSDGGALPGWLTFDPATRTFTGTPGPGDSGPVRVTVTASDGTATVSDEFALMVTVRNTAPEVANPPVDQEATTGDLFTYVVPADAFTDADGDMLTYTAALSDGGMLPSWLTFDPATRTFTGTPGPGDSGPVRVTVTASDGTATVSDEFALMVTVGNTPPVVANPLADQEVTVDVPFTYVVPEGAFTDADGDMLTYTAALSDGGMLPSWLTFDPVTRTFTGTPGPGDSGPVRVTVTASDGTTPVSDEFALRVHMVAPSTLQAWTSRFGRTVATHVTDAVGERLRPSPEQDSQVTVGGYRLPLGRQAAGGGGPETATAPKTATDRLASLLTGLVGRALGLGPAQPQGGGPGTDLWAAPPAADPRLGQSQTLQLPAVRLRDVLLGSSFRLNLGDDDASPGHLRLTAWGRVAGTQFNGRDGAVTLDGNVLTGTVGVDSEWDRLLAGLAVSHSLGGGSFSLTGAGGDDNLDNSTLTSIHPYLRYAVNERVDVWSVLGYGWGDMTLEPGTGGTLETDTTLLMGSFGGRGILLSAPDNAGFQLATRADAMLTRMTSDAVAGFAETEADAHRLRLVLEGTRPVLWPEGQSVTPTVELGVRHDWGDAETGFGLELGGRVQYADPTLGLTIEAAVRGLLTHEDSDYKEWGASGTIRLAPDPNGQGLSLTLAPTWGAASSGIESLWSRQTTAGLAPQGTRPRPTTSLNAEMGYGVAVPFGTGLLTPYAGALLSDGTAHSYRLGTRWTSASGLTLNVEGTRQDQAGQQPPTQGLQFQVTWGF